MSSSSSSTRSFHHSLSSMHFKFSDLFIDLSILSYDMTHLEKCGRWERDSVLGERFSAGREIQCWERDSVLGERFMSGVRRRGNIMREVGPKIVAGRGLFHTSN